MGSNLYVEKVANRNRKDNNEYQEIE